MKKSNKKSSLKIMLLIFTALMIMSVISMTSCSFVKNLFGGSDSEDDISDDVTTIAKWQVSFGADETVLNETVVFDLLETLSIGNSVAPGSKGSFKLVCENVSEKNAIYTVNLTDNRTDDFVIRYSYDNEVWFDSAEDINEFLANKNVEAGKSVEHVIYWEWAFDDTGATDTGIGINAKPEVTASITVTAAD